MSDKKYYEVMVQRMMPVVNVLHCESSSEDVVRAELSEFLEENEEHDAEIISILEVSLEDRPDLQLALEQAKVEDVKTEDDNVIIFPADTSNTTH